MIILKCSECNSELTIGQKPAIDYSGDVTISIKICNKCLDKKYDEGYDDGYRDKGEEIAE